MNSTPNLSHMSETSTQLSPLAYYIDEMHIAAEGGKLLSDEITNLYIKIIYFVILPINIAGFVTNAINMRVFSKQGLGDTTNIALFSLSLTELAGCLLILPSSLCWIVNKFGTLVDFYNCVTHVQMPFGYPHVICSRVASWITVYLSVERALCVLMPLKVKTMFRPKITVTAMVAIWGFFIIFHIPFATVTSIAFKYNKYLNATIAVTEEKEDYDQYQTVTALIGTTTLSSSALIIVFICTVLMMYRLNQSRNWRQSFKTPTAAHAQTGGTTSAKPRESSKDLEVLKTVTVVTTIFLVCLSMSHIPSSALVLLPGVTISGVNSNVFNMALCSKFLFSAINATANFFGYLRISSKYKTTFYQLFPMCSSTKDPK